MLGNEEVNALVASRPRFSALFRASAFELLLGCLRDMGEGSDRRLVNEDEFRGACSNASVACARVV